MKRPVILTIFLLFITSIAFAVDFGILVNTKIENDNDIFSFNPGFTPWFSIYNGKGLSFYLSGLLSLNYTDDHSGNGSWDNPVSIVPELSRFTVSYRSGQGFIFEAGRTTYTDTLGITASGFFDGARMELHLREGNLSIGAFYTGLLYKETAKIRMTEGDIDNYHSSWNWESFENYFAPKRFLTSLRWNIPIGQANEFSAEVLAQFDVTDNEKKINSQYTMIKAAFYPQNSFMVSSGFVFETKQNENGEFFFALGALANLRIDLSTKVNSWLGITAKFTTGSSEEISKSFLPVNSVPQGMIFQDSISGLALIGLDYNIKIINNLFADCAFRYFIRTYDAPLSDGNFYGGELWASLAWQPLDDVRATFGAGAFFPGLGNAYPADTAAMFKISAGLILSL